MTLRVLASLSLLWAAACSAPERANPTPRCKSDPDCPVSLVCYRGFCVLDDDTPVVIDSDSMVGAAPETDGSLQQPVGVDASEPPPSATRDSSVMLLPMDAEAPVPTDAGQTMPPDAQQDGAMTSPVPDASLPDDNPVVDAGTSIPDAAIDAGGSSVDVNRELARCLVFCNAANSLCASCFRNLVNRHPEVCDPTGSSATDAVLRGLCQLLCTNPQCRGT